MWTKYDGRDVQYKRIKIAGREGKAVYITSQTNKNGEPVSSECTHSILWEDGSKTELKLDKFPDFEIWIEDPKISKVAAEELKKWAASITLTNGPLYHLLLEKIDSMTE